MYSFKAFPTDEDFAEVATSLINKHPCLREQGSSTGCRGWKNSLKFKMGNYRSKLCNASHRSKQCWNTGQHFLLSVFAECTSIACKKQTETETEILKTQTEMETEILKKDFRSLVEKNAIFVLIPPPFV
ncbi:hypothetical protein QTP70_015992 [Hemibagrus guttatus]|uniref:Uncharacterized protein n=1 Tax=Hemibagrus guttatus TaxID=175788 RepID=A0AAE0PYT7_9TELE|nr:hypothetical protein QTP70_015992 [Hemibagrus guttatus]